MTWPGSLVAQLQAAWSTSYRDALTDPAVEAVVIATPTPFHAEMVIGAARAGKHAFCEKPLLIDERGGRAAAAAMEKAGRRLQVGFQRRFDPDWMAAKRCIQTGELGAVRLLRISHRNRAHPHGGSSERLGSLFVDMSVHDMDSARWLVGEVAEVSAFADGETAVTVLRFDNGGLGVIDNTRSAGYGFECPADVMGTDSTLRIGTTSRAPDIERLTEDGLLVPLPADHIERHRVAYLEEMREFARCLEDGEPTAVGGRTPWLRSRSLWPPSGGAALITGATSGIGLACAGPLPRPAGVWRSWAAARTGSPRPRQTCGAGL